MFVAFTGYGRIATLARKSGTLLAPFPAIITLPAPASSTCGGLGHHPKAMPEIRHDGTGVEPPAIDRRKNWEPPAGTVVALAALAAMIGVLLNLLLDSHASCWPWHAEATCRMPADASRSYHAATRRIGVPA